MRFFKTARPERLCFPPYEFCKLPENSKKQIAVYKSEECPGERGVAVSLFGGEEERLSFCRQILKIQLQGNRKIRRPQCLRRQP